MFQPLSLCATIDLSLFSANVLRKKYPKHSLVMTGDYYLLGSIYSFPGVAVEPLPNLLTDAGFIPLAPRSNPIPGVVVDSIEYGAFKLSWEVPTGFYYRVGFLTSTHRNMNSSPSKYK